MGLGTTFSKIYHHLLFDRDIQRELLQWYIYLSGIEVNPQTLGTYHSALESAAAHSFHWGFLNYM